MPVATFVDFDLLIVPNAGRYQARVVNSPVGEAQTTFDLPFTGEELRRFTWLSGRVLRHVRPRTAAGPPPLSVQAFGSRLFDAVFGGEVGICLVRSLDKTGQTGQGVRISLRLNDVPELADLPWEYLHASGPYPGFLALSDATPVVRYLELPRGATALRVQPPLRILAVVADPQDVAKLDVEREWQLLHNAVAPLQSRGLIRLERLERPALPTLQRRLRNTGDPVHILHFIGHGEYDVDTQSGGLYFEAENRSHHLVAAVDLAMLLCDHAALRLVFLNACEGARGGEQNLFSGAAQTLVRQGIPTVLAMQFPVSDRAATALSHEFYQALAAGLPVDAAVGEARKAVKTGGNELEWGTPVLFSRSDDNRILVLPEGDARPVIPVQMWEPETMLIPGGPFQMGNADPAAPAAERPQHTVNLPDFRIGKYPLTVREYAAFIKETQDRAAPQSWFNREPPPGSLDHPVTGVSWHDALAYCAWLGQKTGRRYTLPSEAEWEKAATKQLGAAVDRSVAPETANGPPANRYPWGETWRDGCCNAASSGTTPVSAHPAGASAYGVEDLLGNVQEWTRSLWGTQPAQADFGYPYDPAADREFTAAARLPAQARLVHRGGSFKAQPADLGIPVRANAQPDSKLAWRGFRVAMHLEPTMSRGE
jgi:formylglycine-generating enzyme required for sulfatase activity